MKNKKILLKKITLTKGQNKVSLFGFKSLWKEGPKIFPFFNTFYQKNTSNVLNRKLTFSPYDYNFEDPQKRRIMAYEDARIHKNFYQSLINLKVYPTGTKVKLKKLKHSDKYTLELSIPKIKTLDKFIRSLKGQFLDRSDLTSPLLKQKIEVQEKIIKEAIKRGYNYREVDENGIRSAPTFYEDIYGIRNYGVESNGNKLNVRYFDAEILLNKFPFKGRKRTITEEISDDYLLRHKNLEDKLTSIISLAGLGVGLILLSSNITGNVVASLNQTSSNWIGGILLIIGIVGGFFWLKKRKPEIKQIKKRTRRK